MHQRSLPELPIGGRNSAVPAAATELAALVLARLTTVLGIDALQRCWLKVIVKPAPADVLSYAKANKTKESE
jgi:hypothetical protein